MYTDSDITALQGLVNSSSSIVFFGGAGVSTESGIPDFRSADGLYSQLHSVPPEVLISHSYYLSHPEEFFDFYKSKMLVLDAKPNKAHLWLAEAERAGKLKAVVTQNIDGLHQAAGSKTVYELHGSVHRNYCQSCGKFYSGEYVKNTDGVPRCECGGIIKPDVVLYEEGLDDTTIRKAVNAIANADMLLVAGTSLTVYPAAGFLNYYRGDRLVLINRDPTPADEYADLVIHGKVGEVLSQCEIV